MKKFLNTLMIFVTLTSAGLAFSGGRKLEEDGTYTQNIRLKFDYYQPWVCSSECSIQFWGSTEKDVYDTITEERFAAKLFGCGEDSVSELCYELGLCTRKDGIEWEGDDVLNAVVNAKKPGNIEAKRNRLVHTLDKFCDQHALNDALDDHESDDSESDYEVIGMHEFEQIEDVISLLQGRIKRSYF